MARTLGSRSKDPGFKSYSHTERARCENEVPIQFLAPTILGQTPGSVGPVNRKAKCPSRKKNDIKY